MVTFMFHIRVKSGCESQALDTLSAIERTSREHPGCINFLWLQHADRPYEFVLVEQWNDAAALEAHKARSPELWESFVPCLDGETSSEELRAVSEMTAPPTDGECSAFVQDWFEKLSRHVDVQELVDMLSPGDIEMVFPERTLSSVDDFRDWYAAIGQEYSQQSHEVERVETETEADGVSLDVSVVWIAQRRSDGSQIRARAGQRWVLERSFSTGRPAIARYRVISFEDLAPGPQGNGSAETFARTQR
jgi:quinol monooxygenase YgiN